MQQTLFQIQSTTATTQAAAITEAENITPQNRSDLLRLFYGNGQNNPPTIEFHEDSAHGWLQVPKQLIKKLGIGAEISGYSYQDKNNIYLEEDCDLSLFYNKLQIKESGLHKDFWELCPKDYKDHSPIRNKQGYTTI